MPDDRSSYSYCFQIDGPIMALDGPTKQAKVTKRASLGNLIVPIVVAKRSLDKEEPTY